MLLLASSTGGNKRQVERHRPAAADRASCSALFRVKNSRMSHAPESGTEFLAELGSEIGVPDSPSAGLVPLLDKILKQLNCSAGTIHLLDSSSGMLKLAAARGMPDVVLGKIEAIPIGKGMAGIAAERREAVQVCNLQTDTSGVVRPGARDTKMEGSVAAPMVSAAGELRGTIGVAKPVPYEFTASECDLLMQVGKLLADRLPT
jgi:L-methionine (R)-S-oxide reductase